MTLSAEQNEIVASSAVSRLLVLAGPGTGKTYTLIHRLAYLIGAEGLLPQQDLLVLSFSRAAVAEIRSRLVDVVQSGVSDDIRFLNVRTFDSFATRLLLSEEENLNLSDSSYDARISLVASRLLDPDSSSFEAVSRVRHVVVDEIQDLVGVRARLVQRILQVLAGGFTLLGDPAQAIFDYLVERPEDGPTSADFLGWVRETWKHDLREFSLTKNYRVKSTAASIASETRALIMEPSDGGGTAFNSLRRIINRLPETGSVYAPDVASLRAADKKAAILCRTNADVLFASSRLIQKGVPCVVPPTVEERGLPAWIARVLATYASSRISQKAFNDRWTKLISHEYGSMTMNRAWSLLLATEGRGRNDLDLDTLRGRFRRGVDWTFDSEAQAYREGILVTTVHQSKGREYDRVAIVLPEVLHSQTNKEILEEARVLYVASTRAREQVSQLDRHGFPVLDERVQPSNRRRRLGQDVKNHHYFEVGVSGDVREDSFVDRSVIPDQKAVLAIQDIIWKRIVPGTRLLLVRQEYAGEIRFVIAWQNPDGKHVPLGLMDRDFRIDLEHYTRSYSSDGRARFRAVYQDLVVVERRTVVLPAYPENIHEPFASSGICLGLTVRGVISLDV